MADLRLATRGSALARAQATWVAEQVAQHHPGIEVELVIVATSGDIDRDTPVTHLTELGAFVRAVQHAVLDGRADAAIHSCKDLPTQGPEGLAAVHPIREAAWDVLCGAALDDLPAGARVGTGSPRRAAQLAVLRPDLRIEGIRGNVDTRLGKVAAGEFDAVVVAEAGMRRLGRHDWTMRFTLDQMVPAPAQGALAIEVAVGGPAAEILQPLDDQATRNAVTAERQVLALTHLGCRGALGAYAIPDPDGTIHLTGFVEDGDGPRRGVVAATHAEVAGDLCRLLRIPTVPAPAGASPGVG